MPNRLAQAKSLYLRKHAENPIDWWFWCDEALQMAQQQDKPIFLSVGYSSCHWCTVMETEAFSDLAIAEYMNTHFLPIKVDREERPDLDSIYMQAVQMMIGQGGWPLNLFLSPDDRVPFYGGTYFPVEPRYGRPGFLQVLQSVRRYYDQEKGKLKSIKAEILKNLQKAMVLPPAQELTQELLWQGLQYNTGVVSSEGAGPSFPMIPYAEVAARSQRFSSEDTQGNSYNAQAISLKRGLNLALGGIFDHVGGGFHRYTVDSTWTVPHFEKMLYDNGQIVEYLANLWASGAQEPAFERAIALTVQWLQREMTAPEAYFYAAQDADSFLNSQALEPEEGAFYIWDYGTLKTELSSEELSELQAQFTVTPNGNFEGKNVLQRRHRDPLSPTLETGLAKLFQVRYGATPENLPTFPPAQSNQAAKTTQWPGRIPPVTDTKMIVAWNSLMISGLARAATVFQIPDYLELATNAADFILSQQWLNGRFHRVNYNGHPEILAQAEDYALFIKALLDLHQASCAIPPHRLEQTEATLQSKIQNPKSKIPSSSHWLENGLKVQDEFDEYLWSLELGGYYNTDATSDLLVRERSYIDNATPAPNGVAVANLVRFSLLTGELSYLDRAEQTLQAFGNVMQRSPQACPTLFTALDWFQNHLLVRTTADQIPPLASRYLPTTVYTLEFNLPDGTAGIVCQDLTCQAPTSTPEALWQQIQQAQTKMKL